MNIVISIICTLGPWVILFCMVFLMMYKCVFGKHRIGYGYTPTTIIMVLLAWLFIGIVVFSKMYCSIISTKTGIGIVYPKIDKNK